MLFDWFLKCGVNRLEYVLCEKGTAMALVRVRTHPTKPNFLIVSGPAIPLLEVEVPWMELDGDQRKEQFERLVLKALWRNGAIDYIWEIAPFSHHEIEDSDQA